MRVRPESPLLLDLRFLGLGRIGPHAEGPHHESRQANFHARGQAFAELAALVVARRKRESRRPRPLRSDRCDLALGAGRRDVALGAGDAFFSDGLTSLKPAEDAACGP